MNYKIIGADQKIYGPVALENLREWVAQGRVNANTLVQPEGSADWKPLSNLPEFASSFSAVPPPLSGSPSFAGQPDLRKSKLAAGLFGIFLGWLGVHRFYLGYTGIGVAQILVTFFTCGFGWIWGFIEGVLILTGSGITTDSDGRTLKD